MIWFDLALGRSHCTCIWGLFGGGGVSSSDGMGLASTYLYLQLSHASGHFSGRMMICSGVYNETIFKNLFVFNIVLIIVLRGRESSQKEPPS